MLCRKLGKKPQMKTTGLHFMFGTQWPCTNFLGGAGGFVGVVRGSKPLHFRTLNSHLPKLFPWVSLDLALVVCEILSMLGNFPLFAPTSPYFPLFLELRTPTSRPFPALLSFPSHPLFAQAPTPSPLRLPHNNCSLSFFILVKAF